MDGLYIHIPFCLSKCGYCDFCSFAADDETKDQYIAKLLKEIETPNEYFKNSAFDTVYFGGGTPSILKISQLEKILSSIYKDYKIQNDSEITIELNPATADREKLSSLYKLGFNRLSIGMQTQNDEILKAIGRKHTAADFLRTKEIARDAGFENISADLMIGLPNQSLTDVENAINAVLDLEHVSVYSLKIEENTPIAKMTGFPDEDTEREMYHNCIEMLEGSSIFQYEISNFAKKNRQSQHNIKYWKQDNYLGLGLNAHSYFQKGDRAVRFCNTNDINKYPAVSDITHVEDLEFEYIMLRLRLNEGINFADYKARFNKNFKAGYMTEIKRAAAAGLIQEDHYGIKPTLKGFDLQNRLVLMFSGC